MKISILLPALLSLVAANNPTDMNNLTSPYTLTSYTTDGEHCIYNGLKVNNLNLFQAKVDQHCPFPFNGDQGSVCPNGTDMAFANTLYPVSSAILNTRSQSQQTYNYPGFRGAGWSGPVRHARRRDSNHGSTQPCIPTGIVA
jgi:hypothetical protein